MKKHSKKHPKTSQIHQKVDLGGALGGVRVLCSVVPCFFSKKSPFLVFLERFWGPFWRPFWRKSPFFSDLFLGVFLDGLFIDLACFCSSFQRCLGGQNRLKTEMCETWKTVFYLGETDVFKVLGKQIHFFMVGFLVALFGSSFFSIFEEKAPFWQLFLGAFCIFSVFFWQLFVVAFFGAEKGGFLDTWQKS